MLTSSSIDATDKHRLTLNPEKTNIMFQTLFYLVLALGSLSGNAMVLTSISIVIIIYFLVSKPYEHFYFLVGFVPFERVATFGGVSAYFIFILISTIKIIIENRNKKYNLTGLFCLLLLCSIEYFTEFGKISNGNFIVLISTIVYFYFLIQFSDTKYFNKLRIIQNICISYVIVIFQVILSYGSFNNFVKMASTDSQIIRFGEEVISIGGAMGIPLYSVLVISMLLSYYILNPKVNLMTKLWMITMCALALTFGFLTVSRSFILCLSICVFSYSFSLASKQRSRVFRVLLLIGFFGMLLYLFNMDSINNLINSFLYRESYDSGIGIRGEIWQSCIRYLDDYPLGYLWGFGIRNYVQIGFANNLLFSAMAHNLYIDTIMSVGIIGMISILFILNVFRVRLKKIFHTKMNFINGTPLFVFMAFGMTALSLNNFKTWFYVIMVIIFTYAIDEFETKNARIY